MSLVCLHIGIVKDIFCFTLGLLRLFLSVGLHIGRLAFVSKLLDKFG